MYIQIKTFMYAIMSHKKRMAKYQTEQPRSQGSLLPALRSERERDPGKRWSRVSQNLGDYKQTIWGRGR